MLTIVPIPYIAINSIDIAFKAKINAESSTHTEASEHSEVSAGGKLNASVGWGPFKAQLEASASYSSKKDSKATQDSKYSVEYTLDINVKAGQESMPAGLAKVLDILNNSLSVNTPQGELNAAIIADKDGKQKVIATYMNGEGRYEPECILYGDKSGKEYVSEDGRSAVFDYEKDKELKANTLTRKLEAPKATE